MNQQSSRFPPGRAVVFNGQGKPFEYIVRDVPGIKPGELLVRILYTTLCGSDVHTYCGKRQEPPHVVLGHEMVGDIMWIDPDHPGIDSTGAVINAGDRITWSIFSAPVHITPPRPDLPQKSDLLFKYGHALAVGNDVFNGGLADYCIIRANTAIIKLAPSVPLQVAATISCAHATVAGAIRIAGHLQNKKVLVFGAGLLGLSCAAMCTEAGVAYVRMIDTEESRLEWSKKFGSDTAYLFTTNNDHEKAPWGTDADIVFDMTGNPAAMKAGIDALAIGGLAVWIGAVYPEQPVEVDAQKIVRSILQIRGLHNYNYEDFIRAAAFVTQHYKNYPFEALVEKEYRLDEIDAAFEFAHRNKPVRVGIKVNDVAIVI